MDYITIVAPTYEDAVSKARKDYGSKLRIHSRRDISKAGLLGFGKTTMCEITCYLTDDEKSEEKKETDLASSEEPIVVQEEEPKIAEDEIKVYEDEAKTPNPDLKEQTEEKVVSIKMFEQAKENIKAETQKQEEQVKEVKESDEVKEVTSQEIESRLKRVRELLAANDFTSSYSNWLCSQIKVLLESASPELPSDEELEILVLDRIAESLTIDSTFGQNPERIVAILGPCGSGKTTMVAKLAAVFSSVNSSIRRNVRIILLDDSPAVVGQLQKVGKALNIGVSVAPHEAELSQALNAQMNNELVFVDSIGRPIQNTNPDYRIFGFMNVSNKTETKYIMTIPAPMKNTDINMVFEQYKSYPLSGILVTKIDETSTIGNIISASFERKLPLLYTSSGKKIPKDVSKASSAAILRLLQGFTIDINKVLDSEQ